QTGFSGISSMAPITIIPKACSCCKGERSSRDKSSNLPLPNILYEGSEGSEGSKGGGIALSGDAYEVSVTDSPFCVIWHDRHSVD
ncbi:hypothetical protein, partial [Dialister succinatiphilus]|uniref:hypothetical protein n=1 Tax=Dialister succinatiphilus TaxID=487173 RepID=UPI003AB61298